ncbi:MAG: NAD(P)/FAD-dependent oxidoreductase [Candidatus Methanomethylophilus sp.]|nr:NAD(P)/FAD-dependent oxidoreductase [Methanomethylophilus sp.]MDD4669181.1 NAD(P)/FAD-dependent oxidoreductase [Methanomethylophilus sp.]
MPQIAVVGAGPAGCLAAKQLAAAGRDVTVIEEHQTAGRPAHCAGIVTAETIRMAGFRPDILGTVCAADVVFPDGRRISVERRNPIAYVIDRPALDCRLADQAAEYGAQFLYDERYISSVITPREVRVQTVRGILTADLLIGADGQCSRVAASLRDNAAREYLYGMQVDVLKEPADPYRMVLRLGRELAPGFFSWELPLGDRVRVGLCVTPQYGPPAPYLKKLLTQTGLNSSRVVARYVGKIPMGGRRITHGERTLLIGDAAGQVKPVSGGGLYPIFTAAPLLCRTIDRAYEMSDFSTTVLSLYDRAWKQALGKEFDRGWQLRKLFRRLDDRGLNRAGAMMDTPEIREILDTVDLDRPSDLAKPVLAQKGIKSKLLRLVVSARL